MMNPDKEGGNTPMALLTGVCVYTHTHFWMILYVKYNNIYSKCTTSENKRVKVFKHENNNKGK